MITTFLIWAVQFIINIFCLYEIYKLKTKITKNIVKENPNILNKDDDIITRLQALTKTRYGYINQNNSAHEYMPSATNIAAIRQKEIK